MTADACFDTELAELKRMTSFVSSAARAAAWRLAMGQRTRRIGAILHAVPELVPSRATRRVKESGAWVILAEDAGGGTIVAMTVRTHTPGRTIEQLLEPISVTVDRPGMVDAMRLRQLKRAGAIRVVPLEGSGS